MEFKNFSQLLIFFFSVRFQTFQFLRRGFKNCAAGAKQRRERRGGEGRGGGETGERERECKSLSPLPFPAFPSPFYACGAGLKRLLGTRGEQQRLMPDQFLMTKVRKQTREALVNGDIVDSGMNRPRGGS